MAQDSESSVEEILDSIKKVIARDNRDDAILARRRKDIAAQDADADTLDDDGALDAMELTEQVGADDVAADADDTNAEVLDLGAMECVEEDGADAFFEPETEETASKDNHEAPLINDEVRGAMQENLAALAMLAEPGAKPQIVRSGETSLEGLTRELMRPMLSEWLDKNLPSMVEKMVQAEIARIAGKRR